MAPTALLQTGPETFQVRARTVTLPTSARRALGVQGTPPLTVATEIVRLLEEHGALPEDGASLIAAAGGLPGFVEELRSRLG